MDRTSVSLLDRLRQARADASDWKRLHALYLPLIQRWLSRIPGLGDEAEDLAQDVLVVLIREIPRFERKREGSFRAWLRLVTVNQIRTYRKRRVRRPALGLDQTDGFLENLADPNSDLAREWDRDHDRHVFQKLLLLVEPEFQPTTWTAFRRCVLDGQPVAEVAATLGLSENAVMLAKSRILKRLRQEAGDLIR